MRCAFPAAQPTSFFGPGRCPANRSIRAWECLQEEDGGIRAGFEADRHPTYGVVNAATDKLVYRTFARNGHTTLAGGALNHALPPAHAAASPPEKANADREVAALRAELDRLRGIVPDQSHAMSDVAYHFANLWFAGQRQNWPLAQFYLDEARSHLKWAVRIIPVRKDPAGQDVDLNQIREAVGTTLLADLNKTIASKSVTAFTNAHRLTLEGCYSCHKASGKPFLRPQIPAVPSVHILNLDPEAKWPE